MNEALEWWNSMNFETQFFKVLEYLSTTDHPHRVTNEQILAMYRTNKFKY